MAQTVGTAFLEIRKPDGSWNILQSRSFANEIEKEKERLYLYKAKTRWETTYFLTEQLRISFSDRYSNLH